MQAAVLLHSNVHMFAPDLKYRCIRDVSVHSRFNTSELLSLNTGDLPQALIQMSNTRISVRWYPLAFQLVLAAEAVRYLRDSVDVTVC